MERYVLSNKFRIIMEKFYVRFLIKCRFVV